MDTVEEIYKALMSKSPEWRQSFYTLVEAFKNASPAKREYILQLLNDAKRSE